MSLETSLSVTSTGSPELTLVSAGQELPSGINRDSLIDFLHKHMKPYEDTTNDIGRGLDDALGNRPAPGGFLLLARIENRLVGALVMLRTGMQGYVPENLLLFVAVHSGWRGRGIGAKLVREAVRQCTGSIKLHVEHDNPARRLYERLGFQTKYAELRLSRQNQA